MSTVSSPDARRFAGLTVTHIQVDSVTVSQYLAVATDGTAWRSYEPGDQPQSAWKRIPDLPQEAA